MIDDYNALVFKYNESLDNIYSLQKENYEMKKILEKQKVELETMSNMIKEKNDSLSIKQHEIDEPTTVSTNEVTNFMLSKSKYKHYKKPIIPMKFISK